MTALLSGLWPYLAAAGAALLVLWRVLAGAKKAGVDQQKADQAAANEKKLQDVVKANETRTQIKPGDLSDDGFRRD